MLEHKQVPYRRVDVPTLLHPVAVRLRGFDAGGETRTAGWRRTLSIRFGDLLGTVPALAADGQRISTNRQIARFLDERHPEPALFPADPGRRRLVEEAERWANEELQMAARRIALGWAVRDPVGCSRRANSRLASTDMSRSGGADSSSATAARVGASTRSSSSVMRSSSFPAKCQYSAPFE